MNEHLPDGRTAVEFAVRTAKGTKVADVAWLSPERAAKAEGTHDTPLAPEIEVLSPTNTQGEIEEKKQLYFEAGAGEVWTCDADGYLLFFDAEGKRDASEYVPVFPQHLDDGRPTRNYANIEVFPSVFLHFAYVHGTVASQAALALLFQKCSPS